MATQKPLKLNSNGDVADFASTDTIPYANLPPGVGGLTINATPYTSGPITLTGSEDNVLIFDLSSGGLDVALPDSSSNSGKIYWLVIEDSGAPDDNFIQLTTAGSDQIVSITGANVSTMFLRASWSPLSVISDGTGNWYLLSSTLLGTQAGGGGTLLATDAFGNPFYTSLVPYQVPTIDNSGDVIQLPGLLGTQDAPITSGTTSLGIFGPSFFYLDGTSSTVTIDLPNINTGASGKVFVFDCLNATHAVTITAHTGQTIGGNASITLATGQVIAIVAQAGSADEWRYITNSASGAVSSVSNSDGTLTVSPTTGNVIASLAALSSGNILVGNGSNIATGVAMSGGATISNTGQVTLGNPGPSTLGGVESLAAASSKWINQISTSGIPSATQPALADISGLGGAPVANGQIPISTGTVYTPATITSSTNMIVENGSGSITLASFDPATVSFCGAL